MNHHGTLTNSTPFKFPLIISRAFDQSWSESFPQEVEAQPIQIPELGAASHIGYPLPPSLHHRTHLPDIESSSQQCTPPFNPLLSSVNDHDSPLDTVASQTNTTFKMALEPQSINIRTPPPKQGVIRTPRKTKRYISYFDEQERKYVDPSKLHLPTQLNLTEALWETKIGPTPKAKEHETKKKSKPTFRRKA